MNYLYQDNLTIRMADRDGSSEILVFSLNRHSQSRVFQVLTSLGPIEPTCQIYPRGDHIYCRIICNPGQMSSWYEKIQLTRLNLGFQIFNNVNGQMLNIENSAYKLGKEFMLFQVDIYNIHQYILKVSMPEKFFLKECSHGLGHEELLKSGKFADFTINADDTVFRCHKLILAARSPVFDRMLSSDMKESEENQVILTDISPDTVSDMLSYIYTNSVEEFDKKARDLVPVAEKYELTDLKSKCSVALIKQIDKESAVELALMADMYSDEDLRKAAVRYIMDNKPHYQQDPAWRETFMNNPSLLMDLFQIC